MKRSLPVILGSMVLTALAFFQNCGGKFSSAGGSASSSSVQAVSGGAASATSAPTAATGNTAILIGILSSSESQLIPLLESLGVPSSVLQNISASALANGTVSAASVAAATTTILGVIAQYGPDLSLLSSTQKSSYLQMVTNLSTQISALEPSTLTAQGQLIQAASLQILSAIEPYLSASTGGNQISTDNTQNLIQALTTADTQFSSILSLLNISSADAAAISGAALANGTVTSAAISTATSDITGKINSIGPGLAFILSTSERASYLQTVNSLITTLSAFNSSTLSSQAQLVQNANIQILKALAVYL